MKILFTGGGTAGHIFPIIAVAREIRKIHQTPKRGEGREMVAETSFFSRLAFGSTNEVHRPNSSFNLLAVELFWPAYLWVT